MSQAKAQCSNERHEEQHERSPQAPDRSAESKDKHSKRQERQPHGERDHDPGLLNKQSREHAHCEPRDCQGLPDACPRPQAEGTEGEHEVAKEPPQEVAVAERRDNPIPVGRVRISCPAKILGQRQQRRHCACEEQGSQDPMDEAT